MKKDNRTMSGLLGISLLFSAGAAHADFFEDLQNIRQQGHDWLCPRVPGCMAEEAAGRAREEARQNADDALVAQFDERWRSVPVSSADTALIVSFAERQAGYACVPPSEPGREGPEGEDLCSARRNTAAGNPYNIHIFRETGTGNPTAILLSEREGDSDYDYSSLKVEFAAGSNSPTLSHNFESDFFSEVVNSIRSANPS